MTVTRWIWTVAIATTVACGGKAEDTGSGDTALVDDAVHPFVPEGYEYLWNTDGCDGGASVYHLAQGTSDGDNLDLTETWYWFFGDEAYETDPGGCNAAYYSDFDYYKGTAPFSESEVQAIRDLTLSENFLLSSLVSF